MARTHRVVDHIVGYLAATGVEYIFGVDGANIEDVYDAAHFNDDITAVLAKHEFSAATMADGLSRSGAGQPGPGPGADRPTADDSRRPRRLPGHQWAKRCVRRRSAVLRGVGVLPTDSRTRGHHDRAARSHRGGQPGWPRGAAASKRHPAGRPRPHKFG